MKKALAFVALSLAVSVGGAWVATRAWPGAAVARAVWTSAWVAMGVQCVAFALARWLAPVNVFVGWGAGLGIRAASVLIYGLAVVRPAGLASDAAMLSVVAFLFVTTVLEPLFLPTPRS